MVADTQIERAIWEKLVNCHEYNTKYATINSCDDGVISIQMLKIQGYRDLTCIEKYGTMESK